MSAELLRSAREAGRLLAPFTDDAPELDATWAHDVQAADRSQRVAAGETVVGAKLGLTSEAKQQRMNVAEPVAGFLTDAVPLEAGRRYVLDLRALGRIEV